MQSRDKDFLYGALTVIALVIVLSVAVMSSEEADVEMAKAGLQQCVEGHTILWKKECKE